MRRAYTLRAEFEIEIVDRAVDSDMVSFHGSLVAAYPTAHFQPPSAHTPVSVPGVLAPPGPHRLHRDRHTLLAEPKFGSHIGSNHHIV